MGSFLSKISEELDLESQIKTLKQNTRQGILNTKRQFSLFCESRNSTLEEAIEEMKVAKDKKEILAVLQTWVNWLTENGMRHSTIPIMFSHLRTILYYQGIQITNQERKMSIKYPKISNDEKHGLTQDEIKLILETAGRKKKALYLMMLSSGLRVGEAVQLKRSDLELIDSNFMIRVRASTTKTQNGRTTFMNKEATRLVIPFWKMIDDDALIFASNKDPILAKSAEHVRFNDYRKKTGLTRKYDGPKDSINRFQISLHSFRAFFITKVSRHDPNLAKRLAGQKSYLDTYDRLESKEKLAIYKKIEPNLYIYEQKPEAEEITELRERLDKFEESKALDDQIDRDVKEIEKRDPVLTKRYNEIMDKAMKKMSEDLNNIPITKE